MTIARGPSRARSDGAAVARRNRITSVAVRAACRCATGLGRAAGCRVPESGKRNIRAAPPPRHLQQNRLFKKGKVLFSQKRTHECLYVLVFWSGPVAARAASRLVYTVTTVTRYALCTGSILCNVLHMVHRMATTPLPCCIATCDHAHLISPRPLTHPSNRSAAMDAPDACSSSSPPALLLLLLSSSPPLQLYFFSAAAAGVSFKS